MRHDTFCWPGMVFASPNGRYEAREVGYAVAGANHWLHQSDRRQVFLVRRVGEPWQETPMRFAVASWWARLISTDEWPSEGRTRIAIDDDGTLNVDYDGDPVLAKAWIGGAASPWRASLAWNARNWRIVRVR